MNYRMHGKQRTITFGRWPELLLGEARERLLDARRLIANGIDPVERAKLEKIAKSLAAAHTFEAVANEWIEKIQAEGAAAMTIKKARWLLSKLYPGIGPRPVSEISPPPVAQSTPDIRGAAVRDQFQIDKAGTRRD